MFSSCVLDELLQLNAIATFGVGFRIKNVPAMEIAMAIVQNTLYVGNYLRMMDKKTLENYTEKSSINRRNSRA